MSKKFLAITIVFSIAGLVFQFLLTGMLGFFGGLFDIIVLGLLMTLFSRLLRGISLPFLRAFLRNSLVFGSICGFLSILVLLFSLWNNIYPGSLSKITLSDGKRTIVFLEMSHVATPRFYDTVKKDLASLIESGYIAYIEGVTPGKKENQDRFEKMLGMKFNSGTYESMANALGMVAQDNSLFTGLKRESLKNVDISIDDIVSLTSSSSTLLSSDAPIDLEAEFAKLPSFSDNSLFAYMMQAVMNFSLKHDTSFDLLSSGIDSELLNTILSKRNQYVVDTFLKGSDQKVAFLYGGLHFQGMYDLLKRANPEWKILSVEARYPYIP